MSWAQDQTLKLYGKCKSLQLICVMFYTVPLWHASNSGGHDRVVKHCNKASVHPKLLSFSFSFCILKAGNHYGIDCTVYYYACYTPSPNLGNNYTCCISPFQSCLFCWPSLCPYPAVSHCWCCWHATTTVVEWSLGVWSVHKIRTWVTLKNTTSNHQASVHKMKKANVDLLHHWINLQFHSQ